MVVFDPELVSYDDAAQDLLGERTTRRKGMRQGNDVGTTYRSAIYTIERRAARIGARLARRLRGRAAHAGRGKITTEIAPAPAFYFAEDDHQQYLAKNPYGYCGAARAPASPAPFPQDAEPAPERRRVCGAG